MSRTSRTTLTGASRAGLLCFCVMILALHLLDRNVHPITQGISYYANGKFGWLFTASMVSLGLGTLALVRLLWPGGGTFSGCIGLCLLVLWTLLVEAGAFFPIDPPGKTRTFAGRIHSIAGLSFLLLPPAAFLFAKAFSNSESLRSGRRPSWLLAWAVLLASALLFTFNGFLVNVGFGGLVQRAYWVVIILWLFLLARSDSDNQQMHAHS